MEKYHLNLYEKDFGYSRVKHVPVRTLQNRSSACGVGQDLFRKICCTLRIYLFDRAKPLMAITCRDVLLSTENVTPTTRYQAQDATTTTHS